MLKMIVAHVELVGWGYFLLIKNTKATSNSRFVAIMFWFVDQIYSGIVLMSYGSGI